MEFVLNDSLSFIDNMRRSIRFLSTFFHLTLYPLWRRCGVQSGLIVLSFASFTGKDLEINWTHYPLWKRCGDQSGLIVLKEKYVDLNQILILRLTHYPIWKRCRDISGSYRTFFCTIYYPRCGDQSVLIVLSFT